jgi:tellurite resistance protein
MASKTDFTEDEWEAMQKGVVGAGMLVSISDRDFTDTFGEVGALAKYLADQHEHAESPLVRELAETHRTGFGITSSGEKVEAETLDSLRAAVAALTAKAPDEVDGYRQLVLGVADQVANAKGGLAPAETAAIEKVKEAVGAG